MIMRPIQLPDRPRSPAEVLGCGIFCEIKRAIIIGNGFAGAENQCWGLVRALGLSGRHSLYRVSRPRGGINRWLHWLPVSLHQKLDYFISQISGRSPPKIGGYGLSKIFPEADANQIARMARDTFEKNGPILVVASGRDTISVASSIRQLAAKNVFVVQIQHPRSRIERFDLVITPRHDYYPLTPHARKQIPWFLQRWTTPRELPGENVVLTVGALHQADSAALRSAACAWHDVLAPLQKPLLVVNIGGPARCCQYGTDLTMQLVDMLKNVLWSCGTLIISFSRRTLEKISNIIVRELWSNPKVYIWDGERCCQYGTDLTMQLADMLKNVLWSCGTLRISFSRRTPEKISNIIVRELWSNPKVYIWDGESPNPHMGHLAWADAFIVTADSVSMLSEACSTGKPVYVVGAECCTWKFADFQKSLQERGAVRPFTGKEDISTSWGYPPLNDNAETARQVIKALSERGWII